MMDRGLYPVLRTRPGFPRLICLPSTFQYGAYLYVDPRFCLRPPSEIALRQSPCHWLPFASIRLGLDFARYLCHKYQTSPFSSRALPGTQQAVEPDNWYQNYLSNSENKSSSVKIKRVLCF